MSGAFTVSAALRRWQGEALAAQPEQARETVRGLAADWVTEALAMAEIDINCGQQVMADGRLGVWLDVDYRGFEVPTEHIRASYYNQCVAATLAEWLMIRGQAEPALPLVAPLLKMVVERWAPQDREKWASGVLALHGLMAGVADGLDIAVPELEHGELPRWLDTPAERDTVRERRRQATAALPYAVSAAEATQRCSEMAESSLGARAARASALRTHSREEASDAARHMESVRSMWKLDIEVWSSRAREPVAAIFVQTRYALERLLKRQQVKSLPLLTAQARAGADAMVAVLGEIVAETQQAGYE